MPKEHHFMADKPYREALGSIMYAQVTTHPDLSYAVSMLSKYSLNPGMPHWDALTHVLCYIKGMLHFKITYGSKGLTNLAPMGYVDVDYVGDIDTRRLCASHVFMQAGEPTAWGLQYQQTVPLSTTEAEYMSLARSAKQIKWMYSGMDEVGFPQPRPAVLYNDNNSAVILTKNTKHNSHVKHIDIHHHFVQKCVENGEITVCYTSSSENLADIFMEPLGCITHHRACIMLRLCGDSKKLEGDEGDEDTGDTEHIDPGGVL